MNHVTRRALTVATKYEIGMAKARPFYPKMFTPALFALRARLKMDAMDLEDLRKCTHPEMTDSAFSESYERGMKTIVGAVEKDLKIKYPNMLDEIRQMGVKAYLNRETLVTAARRCGFHHTVDVKYIKETDKIIPAFVDTVEQKLSPEQAQKFIEGIILTRRINWEETIKVDRPDLLFNKLSLQTYGREPVTRMLNESGRQSPNPIFVVGLFVKATKVGEGFGQSISMAKHHAYIDALLRHQLAPMPHQNTQ